MTRIAVIDDNAETVRFLRSAFAERGWEMIAETAPDRALSTIRGQQLDAILLDVWLDRPDRGWEILKELKATPETAAIPVVMCSGLRETLIRHESELDDSAAAVLVKPFTLDELYACLDYVLLADREVVEVKGRQTRG